MSKALARATDCGIDLCAYPHPGGHNPYSIELERLDDPLKVVRWIRHLSGKTWFTHDMCRDFIDVSFDHFGWKRSAL